MGVIIGIAVAVVFLVPALGVGAALYLQGEDDALEKPAAPAAAPRSENAEATPVRPSG